MTDDEKIAAIAKEAGAKVPFLRSAETSNDFATTADVISETDITGKINTTGDRGGKGEKEPAPSVDFDEKRKKCRVMLDALSP